MLRWVAQPRDRRGPAPLARSAMQPPLLAGSYSSTTLKAARPYCATCVAPCAAATRRWSATRPHAASWKRRTKGTSNRRNQAAEDARRYRPHSARRHAWLPRVPCGRGHVQNDEIDAGHTAELAQSRCDHPRPPTLVVSRPHSARRPGPSLRRRPPHAGMKRFAARSRSAAENPYRAGRQALHCARTGDVGRLLHALGMAPPPHIRKIE